MTDAVSNTNSKVQTLAIPEVQGDNALCENHSQSPSQKTCTIQEKNSCTQGDDAPQGDDDGSDDGVYTEDYIIQMYRDAKKICEEAELNKL